MKNWNAGLVYPRNADGPENDLGMIFHRSVTDMEFIADLLVMFASRQPIQNLQLPT